MDPATPLYGLDIETDTSSDGLDPARAAVVAVALATADGDEVFLGDEPELLAAVDRRLGELPPGVLVTWNGSSFDLPFLAVRSATADVRIDLHLWHLAPGADDADACCWPPPEGGVGGRWGRHGHLDGYRAFRADVRRSLGLSCGLKPMARLVGLAPVEVDYERLHTLGDQELARYVASDARLARALVQRRGPAALAAVDRRGTVAHRGPTGCADPVDAVPLGRRG